MLRSLSGILIYLITIVNSHSLLEKINLTDTSENSDADHYVYFILNLSFQISGEQQWSVSINCVRTTGFLCNGKCRILILEHIKIYPKWINYPNIKIKNHESIGRRFRVWVITFDISENDKNLRSHKEEDWFVFIKLIIICRSQNTICKVWQIKLCNKFR